ncbi:MAG: ABC transporter substrate-binding protein [Acidobacteria bacterium]|nr:ABC transporter substrate-binding protein [Acidobacteriota bacterium]
MSVWIAAALLAGCAGRRPRETAPVPRAGGAFKLVYQNSPETLDPQAIILLADWEVASLVYEGLTAQGAAPDRVQPLLAESWEESDRGRRWVFTLRQNVYFHDDPCFPGGRGRKVTAGDVLYTFRRIADPKAEWANWYLFAGKIEGLDDFHAGRAPAIGGLRALDERRVEFRLTRPYAAFLKVLASQTACIVPREAVERYGADFGKHPAGTGPFRLAAWNPFERILLVRNGRYWRTDSRGARLPYLDSIDIRFRADATESVLLNAFLKGETHLFAAHQNLYETIRDDPRHAGKFRRVGALPEMSLRFLGFSLDTPTALARHPELRRAVALAFDRAELRKQAPQVRITLADTLVPRPFLARGRSWHPHQPQAAAAIFDGFRKDLAASPITLGSNFQSLDVALLRQHLARLAVKATVQIRPARYFQYIVSQRPSIFRVSFTPSFFDPEDYYCLFYSKSSPDVNLTRYRSEEFDRTLEAAMVQRNPAGRSALFDRLEEILYRDVPAIYLNHGTPIHLIAAPYLHGVALRFVYPDLTEAWLAEKDGARTQPEN